jgi:hypothetical protein
MSQYAFVNNLKEFKKSSADKIGFLTYGKEPPKKMEGRVPALEESGRNQFTKNES